MMMQQTTTLWDSSPVIDEEEEEEQDLDGFDPWGEPLWASRRLQWRHESHTQS